MLKLLTKTRAKLYCCLLSAMFLSACFSESNHSEQVPAVDNEPEAENPLLKPQEEVKIEKPNEIGVLAKKNRWSNKESWGKPMQAVDFEGKTPFMNDNRIANGHKAKLREITVVERIQGKKQLVNKNIDNNCDFKEKRVLWRVAHDASCWVTASLVSLIFQMIEGGPQKFDAVVKHMNELAQEGIEHFGDNNGQHAQLFEDLFDVFALMREKMSHRFSLELRNHQAIHDTLIRGMRKLLSISLQLHKERHDGLHVELSRVEALHGVAAYSHAESFSKLFKHWGISCHAIAFDSEYPEKGSNFRFNISPDEPNDPEIIIFHTSSVFIDALVRKDIADRIMNEPPPN